MSHLLECALSSLLSHAGIPKFYRWLSERYPLLNQPTDVGETPLVDNLYLDMNGIIHNCTHGNDPGTKLTEEEMVVKIFGYLDKLFQVVKPQRLLFMAIDGKTEWCNDVMCPCVYTVHKLLPDSTINDFPCNAVSTRCRCGCNKFWPF